MHWGYISLALIHRFDDLKNCCTENLFGFRSLCWLSCSWPPCSTMLPSRSHPPRVLPRRLPLTVLKRWAPVHQLCLPQTPSTPPPALMWALCHVSMLRSPLSWVHPAHHPVLYLRRCPVPLPRRSLPCSHRSTRSMPTLPQSLPAAAQNLNQPPRRKPSHAIRTRVPASPPRRCPNCHLQWWMPVVPWVHWCKQPVCGSTSVPWILTRSPTLVPVRRTLGSRPPRVWPQLTLWSLSNSPLLSMWANYPPCHTLPQCWPSLLVLPQPVRQHGSQCLRKPTSLASGMYQSRGRVCSYSSTKWSTFSKAFSRINILELQIQFNWNVYPKD